MKGMTNDIHLSFYSGSIYEYFIVKCTEEPLPAPDPPGPGGPAGGLQSAPPLPVLASALLLRRPPAAEGALL